MLLNRCMIIIQRLNKPINIRECGDGNLHAHIHSDIIIRRPNDFSIDVGERGIIQSLSILPLSYLAFY